MKRITINGFGRIGRAKLKVIINTPGLEVVAINDLMNIDNAVYLLKYDSVYEKYENDVDIQDNDLCIGDIKFYFFLKKTPQNFHGKNCCDRKYRLVYKHGRC